MNIIISPRRPGRAVLELAGWLAVTGAAAALGALASVDAAGFYAQLDRPAWAPPAWLFGPVWSVLYLMMAVAAWRVGRIRTPPPRPAWLLYLAQLALNALWSWLFFAWHLGAPAFACIVALWLMMVATIVSFGRRERLAAILLWPCLAWVSFAGALCLAIWQRNPALL